MATPGEEDLLALEDRPAGEPVSFGPHMSGATNPFWSERVRDEASLMAMRPAFLPVVEGNLGGPEPAEGSMAVAHLAACRLERVVPAVNLENMSPEARRVQGNRELPSPEQVPMGGDLTEVLRAILQQNQVLARELAVLKQKVEGNPPRDSQTPVLVTPSSSVGGKKDEEVKVEGRDAIEQGRVSPIGVGVGAGQFGLHPDAPDGPGETGVVAGGELPPRTPGCPGEVGVGTGGEYSLRAPRGPSAALTAPGAGGVCQPVVNLLALTTPPSLPALARDAEQAGEGRLGGRPERPGIQGQKGDQVSGGTMSGIPGWSLPGIQGQNGGMPFGFNLGGFQPGVGGGGGGIPTFNQPAGGDLPFWLKSLASTSVQETIRTVELPKLPEIRDGELGSLVVGDWIALVSPTMKDLSGQSCKWWEAVLRASSEAYAQWLRVDPLQKLYVAPEDPCFQEPAWARVEQRGQAMMLAAIPEGLKAEVLANRTTSTVQVLFRIFTRYQPGGMAERALLLRQLVEPKSHSSLGEMVEHLREWKRWLRRAGELRIAVPDPTLLVGALEKLGASLVKQSVQASFRLSSARAHLQIDVNPTEAGVTSYADVLLAEAESALHSGSASDCKGQIFGHWQRSQNTREEGRQC